jgi:membrane-associated protein
MSLTDQLLAALLLHGLPVLFGIIAIASVGVPVPVSLMLVAAGAFAEQGEMELWPVIAVSSAAAVLGDQIGYGLARWGGRPFIARISRRFGGESKIKKAEALAMRWGGLGIFVSRWLVTGLGPWLNITSGIAAYPWPRFLFWDILGEVLWVILYVMLGYVFSGRVEAMAEVLGSLTWVILGLIGTAILGWRVVRYFRPEKSENSNGVEILAGGEP